MLQCIYIIREYPPGKPTVYKRLLKGCGILICILSNDLIQPGQTGQFLVCDKLSTTVYIMVLQRFGLSHTFRNHSTKPAMNNFAMRHTFR